MSRLARNPIVLASNVSCAMEGSKLNIKGPKGSLSLNIPDFINLGIDSKGVMVSIDEKNKKQNFPMLGTIRATIVSYVKGVLEMYKKTLELSGTGYKASVSGKVLEMILGYSHPIKINIPDSIEVKCPKPSILEIVGLKSEDVGQFAAEVESYRVPTPYKGGAILGRRVVIKKAGKK